MSHLKKKQKSTYSVKHYFLKNKNKKKMIASTSPIYLTEL